ncbi:MAG: DEAD/DEAH box helicase [Dehalococcoidia bacterium]|nr:DEAD/DEAH box helicase [Dehalococcoidia bacterium]
MNFRPQNPLIVQSDKTVLLEVDNPLYGETRDILARFAELVKSPEHVHTYRLTPLSLWNAAAAGMSAQAMVEALDRFGKYDVPGNVKTDILEYVSRYGRLKLMRRNERLLLVSADEMLLREVWNNKQIRPYLLSQVDAKTILVDSSQRGHVKMALIRFGFPAEDLAGYVEGAYVPTNLLSISKGGLPFALRRYQEDSIEAFHLGGGVQGGSGIVALPCGAGKTVVGLGVLAKLQCATLILCSSTIAVRQWIREILDKTNLTPEEVGEYSGDRKEVKPITVVTYQILIYRSTTVDRETGEIGDYPHLSLFNQRDWGLIIYDEVHLLPAPVFRITAEIQARRRLGLTATLIREDGRETDVFGLIGPKKYDVPWKDLERQGWIATAECHEIRVALPPDERLGYAMAEDKVKYSIAAQNSRKLEVLSQLVGQHSDDNVLVIGQYIDQLKAIARCLEAPLITGKTPNRERDKLYQRFRDGEIKLLVISKVGNFAIDLPEANVAIQVSGSFGSRQEEAQRLGRVLRPKRDGGVAHFYSLVTRDTKDQDFAAKRQLFLTEQGYSYTIADA